LGIQLWKRFPLPNTTTAEEIQAYKVWEADWTQQATPLYILLSDIFGPKVPAEYGNNDRVFLNSVRVRERILESYTWLLEL
jgi:stringent starvation protein B